MSTDQTTDTRFADGLARARTDIHAVFEEWGIDLDAPLPLHNEPRTFRELIENKLYLDALQGLVNDAMERRDLRTTIESLRAVLGDTDQAN